MVFAYAPAGGGSNVAMPANSAPLGFSLSPPPETSSGGSAPAAPPTQSITDQIKTFASSTTGKVAIGGTVVVGSLVLAYLNRDRIRSAFRPKNDRARYNYG